MTRLSSWGLPFQVASVPPPKNTKGWIDCPAYETRQKKNDVKSGNFFFFFFLLARKGKLIPIVEGGNPK